MSGINIPAFPPIKIPKRRSLQSVEGTINEDNKNMSDLIITGPLKNQNAQSILSIGNGVILKGRVVEAGHIIIHGCVEAEINANSVEVMEDGSCQGSIKTCDLSVSGSFKGNAEVSGNLIIQNGGSLDGDVTYGSISVERGGVLVGALTNYTANIPLNRPDQNQGAVPDVEEMT